MKSAILSNTYPVIYTDIYVVDVLALTILSFFLFINAVCFSDIYVVDILALPILSFFFFNL